MKPNSITLQGFTFEDGDGTFITGVDVSWIDHKGHNTSTDSLYGESFRDEDEAELYLSDTLMYDLFHLHLMELFETL